MEWDKLRTKDPVFCPTVSCRRDNRLDGDAGVGAARSCGLPSVIRNRHYSVQAAAVSHRSEID